MKSTNLVSIITPAYNCEKSISETINSVLAQTYHNWDMIIVNDKSTDNTENIIKEYAQNDGRIRCINLTENSGVAVARNTALKNATGRFIAFLDSDDIWKKEKLEKQINFMLENGYGFSFTAYEFMKLQDEVNAKVIYVPKSINYKQNLKNTIIGCLTVVVDKDIIHDFSMPLIKIAQDHSTWLAILKRGNIAYGLNESLAEYRKTEGSLSSNKIVALKGEWFNYRKVLKLPFLKCCYYYSFYVVNAVRKHYLI